MNGLSSNQWSAKCQSSWSSSLIWRADSVVEVLRLGESISRLFPDDAQAALVLHDCVATGC
ncbi:hypothetical protein [Arenicella xantha]|uniref:hypothetical protein n=1 Tax=Arenicella xantha TaxID=644221 RepID=UPI000DE90AA4|nr:hypothetical protein [Arenicella xantha]